VAHGGRLQVSQAVAPWRAGIGSLAGARAKQHERLPAARHFPGAPGSCSVPAPAPAPAGSGCWPAGAPRSSSSVGKPVFSAWIRRWRHTAPEHRNH